MLLSLDVTASSHEKMVGLVDRMLVLNKQKHSGKLAPSQVDRADREIAATDVEIDESRVQAVWYERGRA